MWDADRIARLRSLHSLKLTYATMASIMGVSRSAISGAVHRHLRGVRDTRVRNKGIGVGHRQPKHYETPHTYVEPWKEYTARKQKERAEAKAAALQLPSRHAESAKIRGSEG